MKGGLDWMNTVRQYDIWLKSVEVLASCDPTALRSIISKAVKIYGILYRNEMCIACSSSSAVWSISSLWSNKRVMHEAQAQSDVQIRAEWLIFIWFLPIY